MITFVGVLLAFELVQRLALRLGRRAHEWSVVWLNRCVKGSLWWTGTKVVTGPVPVMPEDRPVLILANHQSLFDIPFIHCLFFRRFPRFIAKLELSRWLPSVSFNLKYGQNAIVDRSNPRQAFRAISQLAADARERKFVAVLFPEGTRARDGAMRSFKPQGVSMFLRACPEALVLPVAIDGSWRLASRKFFPVPYGVRVSLACGPLIENTLSPEEICERAEAFIRRCKGLETPAAAEARAAEG